MDIQEAESHADGLGRDLMHWDIDWQSCSNQTCHDHCSRDDCIQMCDGMSLCEDASLCMKEDCEETTCLSSCSSDPQHCLSVGVEDTTSTQGQHALQDGGVDDHPGSIQCPWILPGEPCDVTVGTRNALGRHIYEKHIDPQLTLRCPLESCTELIPKSNLPSHQAQQHRLENYPCSWDSCANIYPTSDDLFNHIMTSHGYLDCHFGGCEVSLKDPTQLQNHVVEDHLDVDFSWPDDFMFDQQLPPNDGRGFEPFSAAVPRNQSYPEYECGGEHCQLHYHGSSCPYGPGPDHSAIGSHKPANLAAKIVEQQKLPRTYADRFESVWRESRLFHQPQSILAKNGSSSETSSPLSCTGSTTAVSEQGRQLNGRNCKWVVNSGEQSLCNRAFDTAEDLQEHLTNDHCKQNKASRSAPKIKPVCRWHGCGRNGEPLNDTHKLIRHVLTHSDHRAFDCSDCGKVFKTKGERDNHERMHRGEKPFKCEVCGKACSNETQLTIHRRTHTGEKPYHCDVCEFTCADSTNLIKHKKTHGPKEFRCDICGSEFGRKHTLERHQRTVHWKMQVASDQVA